MLHILQRLVAVGQNITAWNRYVHNDFGRYVPFTVLVLSDDNLPHQCRYQLAPLLQVRPVKGLFAIILKLFKELIGSQFDEQVFACLLIQFRGWGVQQRQSLANIAQIFGGVFASRVPRGGLVGLIYCYFNAQGRPEATKARVERFALGEFLLGAGLFWHVS